MTRRQECTGLWVWNTANDTPGYSSLFGKYSIFFNHTSLTPSFQTNSLSQLSQSSRIDRTFRQSSMVGNNSFLSNYECSIPFRHTRALITILRLRLPFVIKIKRHSTSRGGARCMELHCSDRDWDGKSIGFFLLLLSFLLLSLFFQSELVATVVWRVFSFLPSFYYETLFAYFTVMFKYHCFINVEWNRSSLHLEVFSDLLSCFVSLFLFASFLTRCFYFVIVAD